MIRKRLWAVVCWLVWLLPSIAIADDTPPAFETIFPLAPETRTVSGPRPIFHIGFTGVDAHDVRRMRFKLVLREDGLNAETYVFDQRRRKSGWTQGSRGEVIYRPRKPLRDGEFVWTVMAWNGVNWVAGGSSRTIRIDTVPPADVLGLTLAFDRDTQELTIDWDPVSLDQQSHSEFVSGYHVYALPGRADLPVARPYRIGIVEVPRFVERVASPEDVPIIFYRVVAMDQAGNVSGLRN
jgi:hypothetical protein